MIEVEQWQSVVAVFRPRRLDDLRPDAAPWVGRQLRSSPGWVITEEDGGPYVGEWAMLPPHDIPLGWVPQGDLQPA